jgi:hypothetical protein
MNRKTEYLKKKIEEMKNTKVAEAGATIGEIVQRERQEKWVNNHVEAIINTVLAMHNRWDSFGGPRFEKYQHVYYDTNTLYKLKELIENRTESEFCDEVLGFNITKNHNWRYLMLCDMVDAFIKYQEDRGLESDNDAMMKWAEEFDASNENDPIINIKYVGLATVQNLRLCLGTDTIKPDVHVKNALAEIGLGDEVQICELVSELTGIPRRELDQIFWKWGLKSTM